MSDKEMVGVRLPNDVLRKVEEYADEHDISKSDALRRMVRKGVDLEEAGLTVAASQSSDPTEEKDVRADGGQVMRPILQTMTGITALALLFLFFYGIAVVSFDFPQIIGFTEWVGSILTYGIFLAALTLLLLYTDVPERIDQKLYSGVYSVRNIFRKGVKS